MKSDELMTRLLVFVGLVAEFGTTQIPLAKVAVRYLGMASERDAKRAATLQQLPVPVFRLGSQKSGWHVAAEDLADHILARRAEGRMRWEAVQGEVR